MGDNFKEFLDNLPTMSADEVEALLAGNESTDRYRALGIPYPDPATMCKGPCDGVGFYPCKNDDLEPQEIEAWRKCHEAPDAHADGPCDGWHFITCADCLGTGKAPIEV